MYVIRGTNYLNPSGEMGEEEGFTMLITFIVEVEG
jgi:hypothetical protein